MTRGGMREYVEAVRGRYLRAGKGEKGRMLDEFCRTTGHHRKAAVRLLNGDRRGTVPRRSPARRYGPEVAHALYRLWEAAGGICSKRLVPFVPELVAHLERHGELALEPALRAQVLAVSAATADRLLRPLRPRTPRRPVTGVGATAALRAQVPLRTFGEWAGGEPGAMQADLVAHCGETTAGFYLNTLTALDVASGWTELEAVWGKGQARVAAALERVRRRLPFVLRELHTDNGSEFLNATVLRWREQQRVRLTRGRPYRKNDQAYAEQRNWTAVRRPVGYDRYSSRAAHAQLAAVYRLLTDYLNFFQPVQKLVGKERTGAKVVKRYDRAQTPYQRLLAFGDVDHAAASTLAQHYQQLNPLRLRAGIEAGLERLWSLSDRPRSVTIGVRQPSPFGNHSR